MTSPCSSIWRPSRSLCVKPRRFCGSHGCNLSAFNRLQLLTWRSPRVLSRIRCKRRHGAQPLLPAQNEPFCLAVNSPAGGSDTCYTDLPRPPSAVLTAPADAGSANTTTVPPDYPAGAAPVTPAKPRGRMKLRRMIAWHAAATPTRGRPAVLPQEEGITDAGSVETS